MKPFKATFTSVTFLVCLSNCYSRDNKDIIPYVKMSKNGPEYSYNPEGYFLKDSRGGRGYPEKNEKAIDATINESLCK